MKQIAIKTTDKSFRLTAHNYTNNTNDAIRVFRTALA
jgi:hypothetical protein